MTEQSQLSGWVQVGLHVSQSSAGIKGTRGLLLNADVLFARNIQKELWAPSHWFLTQAICPAFNYRQLQTGSSALFRSNTVFFISLIDCPISEKVLHQVRAPLLL